jgi:predicted enzyme related to lactoylglutathione lyase
MDDRVKRTIGLVLDCHDPDALASFWSAALGYKHVGSAGNYAMLVAEDGDSPKLLLQKVPEAKTVKNRMHLDIEIADVDAEVARLEALGARRIEAHAEHGMSWVVMNDPEGNEFCVCDASGVGSAG